MSTDKSLSTWHCEWSNWLNIKMSNCSKSWSNYSANVFKLRKWHWSDLKKKKFVWQQMSRYKLSHPDFLIWDLLNGAWPDRTLWINWRLYSSYVFANPFMRIIAKMVFYSIKLCMCENYLLPGCFCSTVCTVQIHLWELLSSTSCSTSKRKVQFVKTDVISYSN